MGQQAREHHVDQLASRLRSRLLGAALAGEKPAGEAGGPASPRVALAAMVECEAGVLAPATRAAVAERAAQQALGLGPLEPLLRDPDIDEVLVSGTRPIWVERGGVLERTDGSFATEAELREAIERLLARAGRRADESEPICARMPDGSRVNVVLPPLAVDEPALTIRRFHPRGLSAADLVDRGTITAATRDLLAAAVAARLNVLVCGATGSGKTTRTSSRARRPDRRRRARRDDRGHGRAAPRSAARRAPGDAAGERRDRDAGR